MKETALQDKEVVDAFYQMKIHIISIQRIITFCLHMVCMIFREEKMFTNI